MRGIRLEVGGKLPRSKCSSPSGTSFGSTDGQKLDENLTSLVGHLPEDVIGVNRDIGSLQSGFMRFGAKHNDIFPVLADMIRWSTGLPSRREAS